MTATFPPYWAGTGNVAYNQVTALHNLGHSVEVFTAWPREREPLSFPYPVHYLPAVFRLGNAPLTLALGTRLKGFDLIHLHYPYIFGAEICAVAAHATGTPLIVTYHNDLLSPGWKGSLFAMYSKSFQRWELRGATCVVATSSDYAKHSGLSESVRNVASVVEIPNGVDPDVFSPAHVDSASVWPGISSEAPIVLFVGAMDAAHYFKGVPVLIEALSRIPTAFGLFVGEGDLRTQFERLANEKMPGRALFTGGVSHEELIGAYRASRVTVLPSTNQGEAFGVVLLESLACGTPVVASRLPGVRTVVSEGADGYLSPPGDAAQLALCIERCLERERSESMGKKGREKVLALYTWEKIARQTVSLYESVLRG